MIEELFIQNYALIEKAHVTFGPGFNVLTGETGAGKSILIDALGLLLGGKIDTDVIRHGQTQAMVCGILEAKDQEIKAWLQEASIPPEDDRLILRRVIKPQKRGGCYIGQTPVTRLQLEELTSLLVDLHGQHEHQSLFHLDHHRRWLDCFLGLEDELKAFAQEFQELAKRKKEWEELYLDETEREEEILRLRQHIDDIFQAQLRIDEEKELEAEKMRLDQHEKLYTELENLHNALTEDRFSVLSNLKLARLSLQEVALIDTQWDDASKRLESAFLEIDDIAQSLQLYRHRLDFCPERLEEVNARLGLIHGLVKRFGCSVEDVLEKEKCFRERLSFLESLASAKEEAEMAMLEKEKDVIQRAMVISEQRRSGSKMLQDQVLEALADLGMSCAQFRISFQRKLAESGKPVCSIFGLDQVEFLLSANPGEPAKPLKDIASGGELSRITLALKAILSDVDDIPILIFDEIDTGVGGEVGQALGRYLKQLSRRKQVLCITHLASIASFADHHLKVEKRIEEDKTSIMITKVENEERLKEIARMLSGDSFGEVGLQHAGELLKQNACWRENVKSCSGR